MLISPEVRNAIHVGDRILEINGLPVGKLLEEEVSLCLAHIRVMLIGDARSDVQSVSVTLL